MQGKAQNGRGFITVLSIYTERLTFFSSISRQCCCVATLLVYGMHFLKNLLGNRLVRMVFCCFKHNNYQKIP